MQARSSAGRQAEAAHRSAQLTHEGQVADGAVVRADGDRHTGSQQAGQGSCTVLAADAGLEVARGAEVKGDAPAAQLGHEVAIVGGRRPVGDAPGSHGQGGAHLRRPDPTRRRDR